MEMANIPKSGVLTAAAGRTTTGRDSVKLPAIPCMTVLTISITGGTATVKVEYSEDEVLFIPVASITQTSGVQFAIPASVLAVNVTAISGATVKATYRTVVLDNMPAQTLVVFGNDGVVTSPIITTFEENQTNRGVKKLVQVQAANTATTIFTATSKTEIRHIRVTNPTGTDRTIKLWHDGVTDATNILPAVTVKAGGWAEFDGIMFLEVGDTLSAQASAATALTITIYGEELV
jgi:hypothetical protein